jgi:hypothetical protein
MSKGLASSSHGAAIDHLCHGLEDIECVLYRQKMFSMIEGLLNPLSWGAGGAAR